MNRHDPTLAAEIAAVDKDKRAMLESLVRVAWDDADTALRRVPPCSSCTCRLPGSAADALRGLLEAIDASRETPTGGDRECL